MGRRLYTFMINPSFIFRLELIDLRYQDVAIQIQMVLVVIRVMICFVLYQQELFTSCLIEVTVPRQTGVVRYNMNWASLT